MNKRDINNMADIFQRIMMESSGNLTSSGDGKSVDQLYSYGPEKLRVNSFTSDSGDPIVTFYTKKVSDDQNDILHRTDGPAVTFGSGGEGNEFFFVQDEKVDPSSKEYRAAGHDTAYRSAEIETLGDTDTDDLDAFN